MLVTLYWNATSSIWWLFLLIREYDFHWWIVSLNCPLLSEINGYRSITNDHIWEIKLYIAHIILLKGMLTIYLMTSRKPYSFCTDIDALLLFLSGRVFWHATLRSNRHLLSDCRLFFFLRHTFVLSGLYLCFGVRWCSSRRRHIDHRHVNA